MTAEFAVLERTLRERIRDEQNGTMTFFDAAILRTLESGVSFKSVETLQQYQELSQGPRLLAFRERLRRTHVRKPSPWELGAAQMRAMQGVRSCSTWKGAALFKTVFEQSLYPMLLWELKPRTIVEIGSGTGASAVWLADQARAMDVDLRIISVDRTPPAVERENIVFLEGDCFRIEQALPPQLLAALARPWLVIEDAHANVLNVLRYLRAFLNAGDYLVVEDSAIKEEEVAEFALGAPELRVDTHYTDFYGYNATCCGDSIFVKV